MREGRGTAATSSSRVGSHEPYGSRRRSSTANGAVLAGGYQQTGSMSATSAFPVSAMRLPASTAHFAFPFFHATHLSGVCPGAAGDTVSSKVSVGTFGFSIGEGRGEGLSAAGPALLLLSIGGSTGL